MTAELDPADTWIRVQTLLLSTEDVDAFLTELAVLAAAVIDPAASCGITTRYDGRPITVASSDERAATLDESQYADGDGPCLHALSSGQTVSIPDLAAETRWPDFLRRGREQGLRCSLSIPLAAGDVTVGAMNFYAFHTAKAFDLAHQTTAAGFAAQASGAVALISRNARNVTLVQQLEQALTSRTVIDQAIGIVMAQEGCSAQEGFAILRTRSQHSQRKLRVVATDLITDIGGPAFQVEART